MREKPSYLEGHGDLVSRLITPTTHMTFQVWGVEDVDGSTQHAAAVLPRSDCAGLELRILGF